MGGAEAFRDVARRSLPVIVALMLLGAIVVNAVEALQGPRYAATARMLLSTSELSRVLTETQPTFVDAERVQETAQALATSSAVYRAAASGRDLGSPEELRAATSVSADADNDLLVFTASGMNRAQTVAIVNAVASAYGTFRGNLSEASISRAAARLERALQDLPPGGGGERAELERELEQLRVLERLDSSDAVLVDPAVSARQTSPAPLRDSLLGLSLGLVIALVAVAVREAIDTKVRSEGAVEELLGAPVLTSIGSIPRGSRLVSYGAHDAAFADSYALLAAQLFPDSATRLRQRVLAVTSALPNEGKTTTAVNLAIALARRGRKVVLADFDFRKATIGRLFDVPVTAPGALQVMNGSETLETALWTVSLEGPRPLLSQNGDGSELAHGDGELKLLPAGGTVAVQQFAHPLDLAALLDDLRRQADVVVLDTPAALLTVEVAEISRFCNQILLVVREGRVTRHSLRSLRQLSQTWRAEIAGAVLTDTATKAGGYDYGAG